MPLPTARRRRYRRAGRQFASTADRSTWSAPGLSTAAAAADFSGIAPGLGISAAIHRAVISVGEQGTEAVAVTGIAFAASGRVARQHVEFTVNRPFAYEIIDTATDAPLFLGAVLDPTQNN